MNKFPRIASLAILALLLASCAPGKFPAPTLTPTPTLTATPTTTSELTPLLPEHRIGVRVVDGKGEFYDRLTGLKFIPRGNNYIRLANQVAPGGQIFFHSTFNTGLYSPDQVGQDLEKMHADGYNTVRIMLNACCDSGSLGDRSGGVSKTYVANLADFLVKAKQNEIFVILEPGDIPVAGGYIDILDTTWSLDFAGNSATFLRTGGLNASIQRWQDLINELLLQGAPLDVILAYDLYNEVFFESNYPPFSLSTGTVSTAVGKAYDMSSEDDKQRMMDENLVFWIDTLRSKILEMDPTALVTVGFFQPQEPHPTRIGDPRIIETRNVIWQTSADFIDLHLYPGVGLTMQQYVDNYGSAGLEEKPVIIGEYGAGRFSFSTEAAAARALHDWQVESCSFGFDGWLLWTWDSEEQTEFYNALTGEGLINQVLAPINRPDPCQPGDFDSFETNLALGVTAQASRSLPDLPPSAATDGNLEKWWGAGDFAPQWIQLDLGEPSTIGTVRLVVTQSPAGDTRHQVYAGATVGSLVLVHTFEAYTTDGQVLEFTPEVPLENIRYIRVVTSMSPSWIGWKEIEVLAP